MYKSQRILAAQKVLSTAEMIADLWLPRFPPLWNWQNCIRLKLASS